MAEDELDFLFEASPAAPPPAPADLHPEDDFLASLSPSGAPPVDYSAAASTAATSENDFLSWLDSDGMDGQDGSTHDDHNTEGIPSAAASAGLEADFLDFSEEPRFDEEPAFDDDAAAFTTPLVPQSPALNDIFSIATPSPVNIASPKPNAAPASSAASAAAAAAVKESLEFNSPSFQRNAPDVIYPESLTHLPSISDTAIDSMASATAVPPSLTTSSEALHATVTTQTPLPPSALASMAASYMTTSNLESASASAPSILALSYLLSYTSPLPSLSAYISQNLPLLSFPDALHSAVISPIYSKLFHDLLFYHAPALGIAVAAGPDAIPNTSLYLSLLHLPPDITHEIMKLVHLLRHPEWSLLLTLGYVANATQSNFKAALNFDAFVEEYRGIQSSGGSSDEITLLLMNQLIDPARDIIKHTPPYLLKTLADAQDAAILAVLKHKQKSAVKEDAQRIKDTNERMRTKYIESTLIAFYSKYAPEKCETVPAIVDKYKAILPTMFDRLRAKYPSSNVPSFAEIMDRYGKGEPVIDFDEREKEEKDFFGKVFKGFTSKVNELSVTNKPTAAEIGAEADDNVERVDTSLSPLCCALPPSSFLPSMLHRGTPPEFGGISYFILDVRSGDGGTNGKFPTSLCIDEETCNDVEKLTNLLAEYKSLKGETHVVVMGEGLEGMKERYHVELSTKARGLMMEDMARVYTVTLFLLKSGYPYVSTVLGGWGGCMSYLVANEMEEVLEDWDEDTCAWYKYEKGRERKDSGGGTVMNNIFSSNGLAGGKAFVSNIDERGTAAAAAAKKAALEFTDGIHGGLEGLTKGKVGAAMEVTSKEIKEGLGGIGERMTNLGKLFGSGNGENGGFRKSNETMKSPLAGMKSPFDALRTLTREQTESGESAIEFDTGDGAGEEIALPKLKMDFSIGDDSVE
jgi:hypothetical protein